MDALYYARFGDLDSARVAVKAGLRINNFSQEFKDLESKLATAKSAIDIREFTLEDGDDDR